MIRCTFPTTWLQERIRFVSRCSIPERNSPQFALAFKGVSQTDGTTWEPSSSPRKNSARVFAAVSFNARFPTVVNVRGIFVLASERGLAAFITRVFDLFNRMIFRCLS